MQSFSSIHAVVSEEKIFEKVYGRQTTDDGRRTTDDRRQTTTDAWTLRAVLVPANVTLNARNVGIKIVLRFYYRSAFKTRKLNIFNTFQNKKVPYFKLNIFTYENKKLFFSLPIFFFGDLRYCMTDPKFNKRRNTVHWTNDWMLLKAHNFGDTCRFLMKFGIRKLWKKCIFAR